MHIVVRKTGVIVCKRVDNSLATVASKCHGIYPADKVKRWCKKLGKRIEIQRPRMIREYNIFMGGTDRMDENISNCRIAIRGKKWYWQILTWVIDAAVQNAWVSMRHSGKSLTQVQFRRSIVQNYLMKYGKPYQKVKRCNVRNRATMEELRFDSIGHFIIVNGDKKT